MERSGFAAVLLLCVCCGVTLAQIETTYVTTPKIVEAKLGEHAEFFLTYTTPDNSSEFTVLRLGANGTEQVLRVVDLTVTTNPNWTMSANVGVSAVGGNTRKVNITIYSVNYLVHEGDYIARVTGSDGDGQDLFKIRTLASPEKLLLSVDNSSVSEGTVITFFCSGYTGRPRPIVHLLLQEAFNGTRGQNFHSVMSDPNPSVTLLENGTYTLSHNFTWTSGWKDNFVEFRCDISYSIGLGTVLSSARSDPITLNVTSQKFTQIQAKPLIVDYRVQDLEVVCSFTRPQQISQVYFMQLQKKPAVKIVSVSSVGITWQDTSLQSRANASGQVSSAATANLKIVIRNDSLQCPTDFTEYSCVFSGNENTQGPLTETTNPVQVSYTVQPKVIESPRVKEFGSSVLTAQREFRNGTVLQLSCLGQIGSDSNSVIRWCIRTSGSSNFVGLPSDAAVHSQAVMGAGCQYMRNSTITYNVTSSDINTEFLCESGYTSQCNTGTAKQFVNIKLESAATTPAMTTTEDNSNTAMIAGIVVGSLVVLALIVLVLVYFLVIRRRKEPYNVTEATSRHKESSNSEGPVYSVPVKDKASDKQHTKGDKVTGYENKGLEEEQSGKERETIGNSNGHSNGVVNDHVIVKM